MMPRESEEKQTSEEVESEITEVEDIAVLKQTLAEEKARAEANLAGWQRTQADFINYKRRTEQEKEEISQFARTHRRSHIVGMTACQGNRKARHGSVRFMVLRE